MRITHYAQAELGDVDFVALANPRELEALMTAAEYAEYLATGGHA